MNIRVYKTQKLNSMSGYFFENIPRCEMSGLKGFFFLIYVFDMCCQVSKKTVSISNFINSVWEDPAPIPQVKFHPPNPVCWNIFEFLFCYQLH